MMDTHLCFDKEDYELTLFDRLNIIRDVITPIQDKCYISFSGGSDSTLLSFLVDMAIPNNKIPRVFINTGIEFNAIVDFAREQPNFVEVKSNISIKQMLDKYGYPFKSKEHSRQIYVYKRNQTCKSVIKYKNGGRFGCPNILKYQFENDFNLNISDQCCYKMKKEPIHKWEKDNNRPVAILGLRMNEGGQRANKTGCRILDSNGNLKRFKPLNPISDEFKKWCIEKYNIKLCKLYYSPYNFERTGCKGCPYNIKLQEELNIMKEYMPNEAKQCEIIWKPIYEEYRRISYRLDDKIRLF